MNYKPFDPEKARQGDPVVLQEYPNDTSKYLATLNRDAESSQTVHLIMMTEPEGHQYIVLVTDRGVAYGENGRNFHKAMVMAPKPVEYWIATAVDNTCPNMFAGSDPKISSELAARDIHRFPNIDPDSIQTHKITRYE